MTALTRYARLEATALWRPTPDAQRRDVVVSIGEATLIIIDKAETPLTHWSLAAVERKNPGQRPAIFHPNGDPGETLEFPEAETEMVEAIETLRKAIAKSRPHPGRLRWVGLTLSLLLVGCAAVLWLPGALRDHTVNVVPSVKRAEIGRALLKRIERVSGPACMDPGGLAALALLAKRLDTGSLAVLPQINRSSLHLPGGFILLDRSVIEDHEDPDVAAGYVLAERARQTAGDPLRDLLYQVGLRQNFRLLMTGHLAPAALDSYAEAVLIAPEEVPATDVLLDQFRDAGVRSRPYAFAKDITGETTLPLIEADPMAGRLTEPLMSDPNWLRLQAICGS